MMVLGIETATQVCSVALVNEQGLLAETRLNIKNIHARMLPHMVRELTGSTGVDIKKINAIAVSIGPGSFTGLRIGLATAKGLAMAGNIPVTGVATLQAMAQQITVFNGTIAVVLPSRKDEYYLQLINRKQGQDELNGDVHVVSGKALLDLIPVNALVTGMLNYLELDATQYQVFPVLPGAFSVAQLGLEQIARNDIQTLDSLEPKYHQEFLAGKPKQPIFKRS